MQYVSILRDSFFPPTVATLHQQNQQRSNENKKARGRLFAVLFFTYLLHLLLHYFSCGESETLVTVRVLDAHMEGREFVAGERFSVADVVLGYVIFWSEWEKLLDETPNLKRYRALLLERPALPETLRTPPLEQ